MEKEIDGKRYLLDEKRLGEIELPYFMEDSKSMYYAPIDKAVYMPARFQFSAAGKGIAIKGSLVLPKAYGQITAKRVMDKELFMDILVQACENGEGLHRNPVISTECRELQAALYEKLALCAPDFVMLGQKYEYPSFLFSGKSLIGISPSTVFALENGALMVSMEKAVGPYLSYFRKYGNTDVNIIILGNKGNVIVQAEANAEKAFNQTFVARKARIVRETMWKSMASQCKEIYAKHKENYLMHFVEKM